jgi:RNA-directed DNA polymerase
MSMGGAWILEVDIQDFFGSLDHKRLREILDSRMRDGVIRKAIDKWLRAGVMEDGEVEYPEDGTPQGGVVSPVVSNIYLHEVMDKWFYADVRPRLKGASEMVRFADDIVLIFERESDARRVLEVLPKRFGKYGLTLHPGKTRLVDFRNPDELDVEGERKCFDFMGFTHYWGQARNRTWVVKRKTASKRLHRCLHAVTEWCRENRHESVRDQRDALVKKLNGHYNYYGITGNFQSLSKFYQHVRQIWHKWLNRRSQRRSITWSRFLEIVKTMPLPRPQIAHSALKASPTV